jgi:hypothetical protein
MGITSGFGTLKGIRKENDQHASLNYSSGSGFNLGYALSLSSAFKLEFMYQLQEIKFQAVDGFTFGLPIINRKEMSAKMHLNAGQGFSLFIGMMSKDYIYEETFLENNTINLNPESALMPFMGVRKIFYKKDGLIHALYELQYNSKTKTDNIQINNSYSFKFESGVGNNDFAARFHFSFDSTKYETNTHNYDNQNFNLGIRILFGF